MKTTLQIEKREGSAAAVRSAGKVPGVVYGPKQEPINIAIEKVLFEKTLSDAGESTVITLKGLDDDIEVLIHDVSFRPVKGGVEHVDFYAIERGKELTVDVAIEYIGEAPAEDKGLIIGKILHEVEVTTRPSLLPSHIDVDLSVLVDVDSQILVKDLKVAEGVTIGTDPEQVVANVSEAREEEPDEVEAAEVDMDAIEVEGKGKEGDDNEEGGDEKGNE